MAYSGRCLINSAGINSSDGRVHFSLKALDGAFDWTPFLAKQEHNHEVLALAIAAMTSNSNVVIQTEQTTAWAEVWWFDLVK
ncbi:hypothetical protein D7Y13_02355 [Corallococcus praedator]|uniref:Uncharacterized protein n=1 Tax=Corallococcus praedator TaxID=2316724 RepID=A0ABX9QR92_9BACT|nr:MULTISPECIES: hypothetical protein [Corallococcus]RKH08624.1 hypothetical protein D7X74_31205 [Corallococcus sp. CA047B]RKH35278.1 hypothetical protein D7X75_05160 [Corallococcus sp. CA031C]RKI16390.1 hypothetical protein D7Y13_02355 [Corallococcus praedator]